jgi:hypothetical protein
LSRWNPAVVFIPLSSDDFDEHATGVTYPWLAVDRDGNAVVVNDPAGESVTPAPRHSVLFMLVTQRWWQFVARSPQSLRRFLTPRSTPTATTPPSAVAAPTQPVSDSITHIVVRALKIAYGERVTLIYVPDVRVNGGTRPEHAESRMLEACAAEHVTCASMRQPMLDARARGVIARGFSTTTVGVGHLNDDGHRLIATEMWKLMQPRLATLSAK